MWTCILQLAKPVGSLKELELKALLHQLHQPQNPGSDSLQHCMSTLQRMNDVRQLPGHGRTAAPDQLRLDTVKVRTPVQTFVCVMLSAIAKEA